MKIDRIYNLELTFQELEEIHSALLFKSDKIYEEKGYNIPDSQLNRLIASLGYYINEVYNNKNMRELDLR